MPKAGKVRVSIRPFDASSIAAWLEANPPTIGGLLGLVDNSNAVERHDHLVKQVRSFSKRKRRSGQFIPVLLELSREDAARLAAYVRTRGLFGRGRKRFLPNYIDALCWQCLGTVSARRGAKTLRGRALEAAITRQVRNSNDPRNTGDVRWLKRLRKRQRQEDAIKSASGSGLFGLLGAAQKESTD